MLRHFRRIAASALAAVVACFGLGPGIAPATDVVLKDGRVLSGKLAMISTLAEIPRASQGNSEGPLQLIVLLDDDLRRTFVSKRQLKEVKPQDAAEAPEKFRLHQRSLRAGNQVRQVGPALRVQPFDEFGRRIYTMSTSQGPIDIVQGISELTPQWAKVEGVSHLWDMRIATSSIPREVLSKILAKQIDMKDVEQRKKVVRFYLQSERYDDAAKELQTILDDFAQNATVREQLEPSLRALRQLAAQRLLAELRLRRDAGQHELVRQSLKNFPSEGVSGEVLQAVRELIDAYATLDGRRATILAKFDELLLKVGDTPSINQLRPLREELAAELTVELLARLAPFMQSLDDADMSPAEKISLAVSGWLMGQDSTTTKLPVAISAYRMRDMIRQYMAEPIKITRAKIASEFVSQEAASPQHVAAILAAMKPPVATPEPDPARPGYYELQVPGPAKEPAVPYLVQLPPEYNPYHRYPAIVTLQGSFTTTANQLDWWAGPWNKNGQRMGQGARRGYIVIAPAWTVDHQKEYRYSAREHAAVLDCLRDACKRFSIDSDRVFLSGHSIGGDAAWDLGLAHPDLWAGVIPFVARSDRFVPLYWENAELVPYYFVCGELDGGKMSINAGDLDRYLKRGFNTTVVEYLGRGHEDYYDEIQRIFDWMGRFHRDFYPKEFTCVTMRPWDNFFWWVEMVGMPSKAMVNPTDWPPSRGTQPVQVKASVTGNNNLYVRTGAAIVNVYLSPKLVDFSRKFNIVVNGRRMNTFQSSAEPNLNVMLEDVRTRGDRQHPFWAKVEMATGRVSE